MDSKASKVKSLNEYLDEVNELILGDNSELQGPLWIFRGVSNKEHKLEVSLKWARRNQKGEKTVPSLYSREKEIEMFQRFKQAAVSMGNFTGITELDWLCLARHHNLPCRVLDWSESPLVAAYFACIDMGAKGDSAVYATPMPELVTLCEAQKPFEVRFVKAYRPIVISPRIAAQSSVITLHSDPMEEFKPDICHKYVFPAGVQKPIKTYLNRYGIHHQSMFPDLDGIAVNLRWQYKWDRL